MTAVRHLLNQCAHVHSWIPGWREPSRILAALLERLGSGFTFMSSRLVWLEFTTRKSLELAEKLEESSPKFASRLAYVGKITSRGRFA